MRLYSEFCPVSIILISAVRVCVCLFEEFVLECTHSHWLCWGEDIHREKQSELIAKSNRLREGDLREELILFIRGANRSNILQRFVLLCTAEQISKQWCLSNCSLARDQW